MAFTRSDRLPAPDYFYHSWGAGEEISGNGPGYASVKLESDQKIMMHRTNSQRVISRAVAGQKWKIDISYNPMTREEFEPLNAFLLGRQGSIRPFFVSLPQYSTSRNSEWATDGANNNNSIVVDDVTFTVAAGSNFIKVTVGSWTFDANNNNIPAIGDIINILDADNTNHTKAYMITAIETFGNTNDENLAGNQIILQLNTPLVRELSNSSEVKFTNPLFKVVLPTATRSYSLDTNNLYKFGLKLEEFL